jgi:hypothetical protein
MGTSALVSDTIHSLERFGRPALELELIASVRIFFLSTKSAMAID